MALEIRHMGADDIRGINFSQVGIRNFTGNTEMIFSLQGK